MYVSIVDYGTGNLNSVSKALEVAATKVNKKINIRISNKPKDILDSDKIILPGQGSYRQCALGVKNISGLWDSINEFNMGIFSSPIAAVAGPAAGAHRKECRRWDLNPHDLAITTP